MWPYLELSALYNSYNFNVGFYQPPNCVASSTTGLVTQPQSIYYCPSERVGAFWQGDTFWRCRVNYVLNFGENQLNIPPMGGVWGWVSNNGWQFVPLQQGFKDIRDGLSQTLMMSEIRFPMKDTDLDARGDCFNDQDMQWFMTLNTPNSGIDYSSASCCPPAADVHPTMPLANNGNQLISARSVHPGGVQTLLCDGSVRFISNNINLLTWQALSTCNGREVIDSNSY